MNKTKHTPGPWKVTWNSKFYHLSGNDNGGPVKILSVVRDPVVLDETWERQCADAKLIAAAPEMLDQHISNYKNIGSWLSAALGDPKVCDEMKNDIAKFFRSVSIIEKATGQTIEDLL